MRILLLTTILLFATSASAGLYKWVDEEGNVHYSQKRPIDKQYERLKAPPPAPENATPLYNENFSPKQSQGNSNSTAKSESAKNLKLREENCNKAKNALQTYQVYRRMHDSEGNILIIDDKERSIKIKNAQQAINSFCD